MTRRTIALVALLLATPAAAEMTDPTTQFPHAFGMTNHACVQYDDTGRVWIWTEGPPSREVQSWMQLSQGGLRANVPVPDAVAMILAWAPPCKPGKRHA